MTPWPSRLLRDCSWVVMWWCYYPLYSIQGLWPWLGCSTWPLFSVWTKVQPWLSPYGRLAHWICLCHFWGLKAVAVSDTVSDWTLDWRINDPFFGLTYVGDGSILTGIETIYNHDPSKFKAMGSNDSAIPFSTLFTGMMLVQLFYWGTNQAIIQRALAAKNLEEGQKGLILAAFVKILGPIIVVLLESLPFIFLAGP